MSEECIKVYVVPIGMDGNTMQFNMKKTMSLGKLMVKYGEVVGVKSHTLRFCFEGSRIQAWDTAEGLELGDLCTIEVYPELGGMRFRIN